MPWSLWVNYPENIRHALRIRADPSSPQQSSCCLEHVGPIFLKHNGALKMSEIKKKTLFLQKSSWCLFLPGHSREGLNELWKSSEAGSLIRRGLLQSGGDTVYAGRVHVSTAEHRAGGENWRVELELPGVGDRDKEEEGQLCHVIATINIINIILIVDMIRSV